MKRLACRIIILAFLTSCVSIKPYERQFVNDPQMQMSDDSGRDFNNYVYSIREGATPAGSTKASGGCGCN
jgi:hypothetical protein